MIKKRHLPLMLCAGLLLNPANSQEYPKVVQQLVNDGVEVASSYAAPGNLTGYVGSIEGQPVSFFMTEDEKYVLLGMMIDENGNSVSDEYIEKMVLEPMNEKAWQKLEAAQWTREGDENAPTVIYTFTDPNCPYCHRFRQQAQPWIDAGLVQLRHIMVGILRPDSLPKAAVIVASEEPTKALQINQDKHRDGGIELDKALVKEGRAIIEENNQLMRSLGLHSTPSSYYLDQEGKVQLEQGIPQGDNFDIMMGSAKP